MSQIVQVSAGECFRQVIVKGSLLVKDPQGNAVSKKVVSYIL